MLLQHHLVYSTTEGEPPRIVKYYVLDELALLQRARFPQMLKLAEDAVGAHCGQVLSYVMLNGRITVVCSPMRLFQ